MSPGPTRDLLHPRDAILQAIGRIYSYRMTTTSGGNLSIRDDDGSVWITPARLDKGELRREDIVRVRPDGAAEGPHPPSSEYPFHRALYEARPELRGVVHAHPVALVAFSACGLVPDTRLLPGAHRVCPRVAFAPYALPGSEALGRAIAGAFADGADCAILENHGVVTAGASLQEAFERFETLEFCAKTILKAVRLGPVRYLDESNLRHAPVAPPAPGDGPRGAASSVEKELRRGLVAFVARCYRQRLMISTEGAISARLGDEPDAFLITPHRVDRRALEVSDPVLVREGRPEPGRPPSLAAEAHRAIYRAHPGVQALINAYPVNATAFSVTGADLDPRTIPESYVVLRDVGRVPFDPEARRPEALAGRLSTRRPCLLLENDGVLVAGSTLLEAFDRLEVLETTAEAIINARGLAPLRPMPDAAVAELDRAFGLDE